MFAFERQIVHLNAEIDQKCYVWIQICIIIQIEVETVISHTNEKPLEIFLDLHLDPKLH